MKKKFEKIAVFDLDGTLWPVNSHYECLNLYYHTRFWTSFIYKVIAKLFSSFACVCRNYYFSKIPVEFINSMNLSFSEYYVSLLNIKKQEGFHVIIVSNAPHPLIVKNAAQRLKCEWICSPEGKKLEYLKDRYEYQILYVCTDNKSDFDLLSVANEYHIVKNRANALFFKKKGFHFE